MAKTARTEERTIFPPRKILVPIDGSENAVRASEVATALAKQYDAELVAITVITFPGLFVEPPAGPSPARIVQEYFDAATKQGSSLVQNTVDSAKRKGVEARGEVIDAVSSIVESIVKKASSEQADLIVIGSRGLGDFKRILLGSVSSGVVAHAHCSVLVVR